MSPAKKRAPHTPGGLDLSRPRVARRRGPGFVSATQEKALAEWNATPRAPKWDRQGSLVVEALGAPAGTLYYLEAQGAAEPEGLTADLRALYRTINSPTSPGAGVNTIPEEFEVQCSGALHKLKLLLRAWQSSVATLARGILPGTPAELALHFAEREGRAFAITDPLEGGAAGKRLRKVLADVADLITPEVTTTFTTRTIVAHRVAKLLRRARVKPTARLLALASILCGVRTAMLEIGTGTASEAIQQETTAMRQVLLRKP